MARDFAGLGRPNDGGTSPRFHGYKLGGKSLGTLILKPDFAFEN